MAAPFTTSHSAASTLAMRIAAGAAKIAEIDAAATPGYIAIYDAADVELVRKTLSDPCGTVDSGTGVVTITPTGTQSAAVSGTAAYALIKDGDNIANSYMQCVQGTAPVAEKLVMTSLAIEAGETLNWNDITLPVA